MMNRIRANEQINHAQTRQLNNIDAPVPAGAYMYWEDNELSATVSATAFEVALTKAIDPSNYWTVNNPTDGVFTYTGAAERVFAINIHLDIETGTDPAAGDLEIRVEQDQGNGTWTAIPGAKFRRYMSGGAGTKTDHGAATIGYAFSTPQNTSFRMFLVVGESGTFLMRNAKILVSELK